MVRGSARKRRVVHRAIAKAGRAAGHQAITASAVIRVLSGDTWHPRHRHAALWLSARAIGLRADTAAGKTMTPVDLSRVRAPTLIISARNDGYGIYAIPLTPQDGDEQPCLLVAGILLVSAFGCLIKPGLALAAAPIRL